MPTTEQDTATHDLSSTAAHTPGPWHVSRGELSGVVEIGVDDARGNFICTMNGIPPTRKGANAHLIAAAPDLLAALKASEGFLLNAKIDLETGAPKRTAIQTIEGGLRVVRAAVAKAENRHD